MIKQLASKAYPKRIKDTKPEKKERKVGNPAPKPYKK